MESEDKKLSVVISKAVTGKAAEENERMFREAQAEMSARVKASGLTEEQLQQIIDGKAEHSDR